MAINIDPGTWGDKDILTFFASNDGKIETITIVDREHERIIDALQTIRDLTEGQFEQVIKNIRR